ncbi:pseudouridine synthase [Shewanella schlegeliana]|uniref:Pseudouridine synthase n=1 Tax=Shewanella schlegeliana TaxID=190308 RepID=A0ABS1T295_9GAMM|nr:pseudouridine synthase [Shewanella schlegeliana]MBL4914925.1 pseudouridine synthase [Shewanella schlegeliana]MCL1110384.1 pseudouridine synthase [Shewanella schlegeliana]GIU27902.1 RNA pseudouridylate synthase [Shewanella schlegeliana]
MSSSVRASQASYVVLPDTVTDKPTVFSFLVSKFPAIAKSVWQTRILDGKVHWRDGTPITLDSLFIPRERVYYYREVEQESMIPFEEQILLQTSEFMLVFKPHFLAVNPSGNFVNECLVNRLRIKTDNQEIVAAHRLDRATAGVMLLSLNSATRHDYHELFKSGQICKTYQAIAPLNSEVKAMIAQGALTLPMAWTVKNRLQKTVPSFLMCIGDGEANSHSEIRLIEVHNGYGLFELTPVTGRTHQLRVHMMSLGMPLLNDRLYPELLDKAADNFAAPLKLMAQRLCFTDPMTQERIDVSCDGFNLQDEVLRT